MEVEVLAKIGACLPFEGERLPEVFWHPSEWPNFEMEHHLMSIAPYSHHRMKGICAYQDLSLGDL